MPRRRPNLAARWSSYRTRYRGGLGVTLAAPLSPITYPRTKLRGLVEIAPGADLTADPATWSWVDITQWVRHDLGISTTVGRRDQAGQVDPSRASLKLDNRDGRFSRRNPTGPYYGQLTRTTPIRMAVDPGDGMHYRYHGFVNEWPKRWDRSGNDSTVTITCGGTLRRLQRSQPLRSALYRSISATSPLAYWAFEDEAGTDIAVSAVAGGVPARVVGGTVTFGSSLVPAGSSGAADMSAAGRMGSSTDASAGAVASWEMEGVFGWDTLPSNSSQANLLVGMTTPGSAVFEWGIGTFESSGTLRFGIYRLSDSGTSIGFSAQPIEAGVLYHFRIKMTQDGPDVDYERWLDGVQVGSGSETGVTLYAPVRARWNGGSSADQMPTSLSHNAVWAPARATFGTWQAADGWAGEMAHDRVIRVCGEEGIPVRCTAATSAALGPQALGTVLEVLRDAERADVGVLYEHEFGLGYRAISEYYNQAVQLSLDFDAGHVGDPPEADDSDLRWRNQWTVSRSGGSSATAVDSNYDVTQGINPGSTTVNVEADSQLDGVAAWMVHRDTADEDYWTGLKLRFSRTPDIIPAWTALPYGARMAVANPPTQADPGDIDAIVEGWTERWDQVQWEATLNTSPASVYRVAVVEGGGGEQQPTWRLDCGDSTLAADIDDNDTSLSVATAAGPLLSTDAADYPCDIGIGGEQMTITAVVGGSSPQTVTVVRAVNSIAKSHSAGADVRGWKFPAIAL